MNQEEREALDARATTVGDLLARTDFSVVEVHVAPGGVFRCRLIGQDAVEEDRQLGGHWFDEAEYGSAWELVREALEKLGIAAEPETVVVHDLARGAYIWAI